MTVLIRAIQPTDAAAFIALLVTLDAETKFPLSAPEERTATTEAWRERIEGMKEDGGGEIFVVEEDGELAGFLRTRNETIGHVREAHIVVGIRQSHVGRGIGTQLFETLEAWAQQNGVHRLMLTVEANNERALALYDKMGFEIEGLVSHAVRIDDQWVDDYVMAKWLQLPDG